MKRTEEFLFADLYCGAGGMTSGVVAACLRAGLKARGVVVNHWPVAIATHKENHPDVTHYCQTLASVEPRQAVPGGRLHLMCAAPECTHHSNARGGKPMSDQSRSSAWDILKWAEQLYIDNILIENVREFREWGPLGANGRPIKSRKGELYQQFLKNLRALGYTVSERVLNAAYYGDATTRQRLFIQATRTGRALNWPDPTHAEEPGMFGDTQKWRSAREIIDWNLESQWIDERKKPLAPNTEQRIIAGLRKFCGLSFVIGQQSGATPRNVDEPLPTVATAGAISLVQPFLVVLRRNQSASSIDDPLLTMTTSGATFGLAEPFLIGAGGATGQQRAQNINKAPGTVMTNDHRALIDPFLIPITHSASPHDRGHSVNKPLPTLTCQNELGVVEPFLVAYHAEKKGQDARICDLARPLQTVTTENRFGLAEPFLVKFNGTGGCQSVDDPLDTVTSRDRFGLAQPDLGMAMLRIKFRMLQPHELAAAMSFPCNYKFKGKKKDIVKQIGNAVACRTSEALASAVLERLGICA